MERLQSWTPTTREEPAEGVQSHMLPCWAAYPYSDEGPGMWRTCDSKGCFVGRRHLSAMTSGEQRHSRRVLVSPGQVTQCKARREAFTDATTCVNILGQFLICPSAQ